MHWKDLEERSKYFTYIIEVNILKSQTCKFAADFKSVNKSKDIVGLPNHSVDV